MRWEVNEIDRERNIKGQELQHSRSPAAAPPAAAAAVSVADDEDEDDDGEGVMTGPGSVAGVDTPQLSHPGDLGLVTHCLQDCAARHDVQLVWFLDSTYTHSS